MQEGPFVFAQRNSRQPLWWGWGGGGGEEVDFPTFDAESKSAKIPNSHVQLEEGMGGGGVGQFSNF